jgi:hypothetical protein
MSVEGYRGGQIWIRAWAGDGTEWLTGKSRAWARPVGLPVAALLEHATGASNVFSYYWHPLHSSNSWSHIEKINSRHYLASTALFHVGKLSVSAPFVFRADPRGV